MSFTPYDRPVRAAFVGLRRIYDLNMRAYVDNPDVEALDGLRFALASYAGSGAGAVGVAPAALT